jgi:hypothetical protein
MIGHRDIKALVIIKMAKVPPLLLRGVAYRRPIIYFFI